MVDEHEPRTQLSLREQLETPKPITGWIVGAVAVAACAAMGIILFSGG